MKLLFILGILFAYLAYREFNSNEYANFKDFDGVSKGYIWVLIGLAVLCLWHPIKQWHFEYYLSQKTAQFAGVKSANVACNSFFDSFFMDVSTAASANVGAGEVAYQIGWCARLKRYLNDPLNATKDERYSLMVFSHEAMHIRGELDEQKTECQSIQRAHRAAALLGVPIEIAADHIRLYYTKSYPRHPYYTPKCRPGGAYDEKLPGTVW